MSRDCLVALIALVLQFGLGMILNLFITVPPADARAGFIAEVRTAPPASRFMPCSERC